MKQSNYDKWLTTDPNGEPAPELITESAECYGSNWDRFPIDELRCDFCQSAIGFVLSGERDDNAYHKNFIYQDVGGERGEVFCCADCADDIDEYADLVKDR